MHETSELTTLFHPIYDPQKSWFDQVRSGPISIPSFPERVWPNERDWLNILGYKVASPIGIPAGPLFSSDWIELASKLGFDILTYKTIRAHEDHGHAPPNVVFVESDGQFKSNRVDREIKTVLKEPMLPEDLAITNSFGNPSMDSDFLQADIERSKSLLKRGQILIVSVFGVGKKLQEVADDYAKTAILAKEAGADVIEANCSCPNVSDGGAIFEDPEALHTIISAIEKEIRPLPLIVKTGRYKTIQSHRRSFQTIAKSGAQGVCGINTIPMRVIDDMGAPALGPSRPTSGICGAPVRSLALEYIAHSRKIIDDEYLSLTLLGCGGIVRPEHFQEFIEVGAEAALTATGMMWDPYLALKKHENEDRLNE